jgi:hypothetical protein
MGNVMTEPTKLQRPEMPLMVGHYFTLLDAVFDVIKVTDKTAVIKLRPQTKRLTNVVKSDTISLGQNTGDGNNER